MSCQPCLCAINKKRLLLQQRVCLCWGRGWGGLGCGSVPAGGRGFRCDRCGTGRAAPALRPLRVPQGPACFQASPARDEADSRTQGMKLCLHPSREQGKDKCDPCIPLKDSWGVMGL